MRIDADIQQIALNYVKEQLAIMDGSYDKGLARLGTERVDKLTLDVAKTLQKLRKPAGSFSAEVRS